MTRADGNFAGESFSRSELPVSSATAPAGADVAIAVVQADRAGLSPIAEAYADLQFAYTYFGRRLFPPRLPDCLITLSRSRRALGYFRRRAFESVTGGIAHEISLNPAYLESLGDTAALAVLVHEQAHLARFEFGPKRGNSPGYHDRAWARIMHSVGLVPSDTNEPGGKETGRRVGHYVAEGGSFDLACRELLISGFRIRWRGHARPRFLSGKLAAEAEASERLPARLKFTCPDCGLNAWAKPSARLGCVLCGEEMVAVGLPRLLTDGGQ